MVNQCEDDGDDYYHYSILQYLRAESAAVA
jgi:hypothetical protein